MQTSYAVQSPPVAPRLPGWRTSAHRVVAIVAGLSLLAAAAVEATSHAGPASARGHDRMVVAPAASTEQSPAAPVAEVRRPRVPRYLGGIPTGTGMWTWEPEHTEGGNARKIVARAEAAGLTHIYVRTGSSWQGFHGGPFLERILPKAHAAGIKVYGWDFPSMQHLPTDLERAETAIRYRTAGGHRIDGFVADIETGSEGTDLSGGKAGAYGRRLRARVGEDEVLVACVPNPTSHHLAIFPYAEVLAPYDAVAPMIYWLNRQPDTDVDAALDYLRRYDKPLLPVGQAYDGAPEGGRPGPPPRDEIARFIRAARSNGARAISFWSWQHASDEIWQTIADVPLRPRKS
jgi:hypothetical protein